MFRLSAQVKAVLLKGVVDELPLAATVPTVLVGCCICAEMMRFS